MAQETVSILVMLLKVVTYRNLREQLSQTLDALRLSSPIRKFNEEVCYATLAMAKGVVS